MSVPMQLVLMLVFGVFTLFGGVLVGSGIRALLARSASEIGSIIVGAMVGGVTLLFAVLFLRAINPWLFLVVLLAFVAAVLGSAFLPQFALQEIGAGTLIAIGIGGIAMAMGAFVALEAFNRHDTWFGIAWGGCAGFVGFAFFSTGMSALLRGKRLAMKQTGAGAYELLPEEDIPEEDINEEKKARKRKTHKTTKRSH